MIGIIGAAASAAKEVKKKGTPTPDLRKGKPKAKKKSKKDITTELKKAKKRPNSRGMYNSTRK